MFDDSWFMEIMDILKNEKEEVINFDKFSPSYPCIKTHIEPTLTRNFNNSNL